MTRLSGVRLLFVDDRFDIANMYISRARREGADVSYQSKLLGALTALATEHFDLAVIDLHMPLPPNPWPDFCKSSIEAVAYNESDTVRSHNLGQMIGHYINKEKGGKPPFVYLSAVAAYFEPLDGAQSSANSVCYDRYKTNAADLVDIVAQVLGR